MVRMLTPVVDKKKDHITANEYHATEIDLGHARQEKVIKDFNGFAHAMKDKMRKLEGKYKNRKVR